MVTAGEAMTHTFIHSVPIKDQSNRLFMLLVGGTASKLFPTTVLPRNVLFVENLTHETSGVQFLSCKRCECLGASLECADSSALWPKRCQGTAPQGGARSKLPNYRFYGVI